MAFSAVTGGGVLADAEGGVDCAKSESAGKKTASAKDGIME
jgi:hypothetical protein